MKFCTILFVIMFASLSNTKAKPSTVYHVGNLAQLVPITYRHLPLGLRPIQRCFDKSKLTVCPGSQNLHTHPPFLSKSLQNQPTIDFKEKLTGQWIRDANLEYVNYKTFGRLTSPMTHPVKNIYFKLDTPDRKSILNYLSMLMPVEFSHEIPDTFEKLPEKVENVKTSSEIVPLMENSKETETIETTTEKIDVENIFSAKYDLGKTSLENIKSTPKLSEHNISATADNITLVDQSNMMNKSSILALDQFELKLYMTNFNKFLALTPGSKGDSGMSFVQSALFLAMTLMAFSTEADLDTKNEIDQNFGWNVTDLDKITLIKQVISSLPNSSEELKFRWSSRLVLRSGRRLSQEFTGGAAAALQLKIDYFKEMQTPVAMAQDLNRMIEEDSDGAIRDTFEEEDLSKNEEAVLITTLYFRARWRTAPTLLNGTWQFRDSGNASKTIRMIRINDIMKYVDLPEWDAEAIEIPYLTQGLSLLMLVPRGNSLNSLVKHVTGTNLTSITERLQIMRIAVALPLYTLRMTLLLPNKLQAMGISRLLDASEAEGGSLRISQAVQRIMFWAEAGRNAYKDDGLEWDAPPEMNIAVDRPYIFCVRWQNTSLMFGNFVL